jgi:class 3 adenylate cyclase/DNA-binding transcriptional regulator YiaG
LSIGSVGNWQRSYTKASDERSPAWIWRCSSSLKGRIKMGIFMLDVTEKSGRTFSEMLRQVRKRRGWSQGDVAEKVGTDFNTVSRWERGLNVPGPYFIQKLCDIFEKTPEAFGLFHKPLEPLPRKPGLADEHWESSSETLPTSSPSGLSSHMQADQEPARGLIRSKELEAGKAVQRSLPTGTVTLLFTDIEGSTLLLQQLGERYASVLSEYRDLLRSAFRGHHGYEVDTQGDGFFVVFVRAREAALAIVAAQRALTTHSWPEGVEVRVRMGLHTGEPSLIGEGYVGLDVHYAARIMQAAHGGQVLLSQTTHDLVENDLPFGVSLRDLGKHRLKDLQRPAHLYQLDIVGLHAEFPPLKTLDSRPNNLPVQLTPLIGREKEVAAVQKLLQREDVRLVTLTGPGGTGKTRLGLQVAAELSDLFADGVYFVNLTPLSDPTLIVSTIAQTLDLKEMGDQPLHDLLKGYLRDKQLLLLLDNFEQVASAALQVTDLLAWMGYH